MNYSANQAEKYMSANINRGYWRRVVKSDYAGFLPVIFFLIVWETIARLGFFPKGIFPSVTEVVLEFFILLKNGVLPGNFWASLFRVFIGFTLGSLLGIFMGVLMGWNRWFDKTFSPIVSLIYPIPALGWLPILMLWIGINEALPITIIFMRS